MPIIKFRRSFIIPQPIRHRKKPNTYYFFLYLLNRTFNRNSCLFFTNCLAQTCNTAPVESARLADTLNTAPSCQRNWLGRAFSANLIKYKLRNVLKIKRVYFDYIRFYEPRASYRCLQKNSILLCFTDLKSHMDRDKSDKFTKGTEKNI